MVGVWTMFCTFFVTGVESFVKNLKLGNLNNLRDLMDYRNIHDIFDIADGASSHRLDILLHQDLDSLVNNQSCQQPQQPSHWLWQCHQASGPYTMYNFAGSGTIPSRVPITHSHNCR